MRVVIRSIAEWKGILLVHQVLLELATFVTLRPIDLGERQKFAFHFGPLFCGCGGAGGIEKARCQRSWCHSL
jgi:hypothetical protein